MLPAIHTVGFSLGLVYLCVHKELPTATCFPFHVQQERKKNHNSLIQSRVPETYWLGLFWRVSWVDEYEHHRIGEGGSMGDSSQQATNSSQTEASMSRLKGGHGFLIHKTVFKNLCICLFFWGKGPNFSAYFKCGA